MKNQKMLQFVKVLGSRVILGALLFGAIGAAGFIISAATAMSAGAGGGLTVSVVGASTGTNVAVVSTVPSSYFGVKIASAAVGDIFKVFNSSNGIGSNGVALTLSTEAGLLDVVQISSDVAGQPQVNYPYRGPVDGQARNASVGISVMKSAAGGVGLVNWQQ